MAANGKDQKQKIGWIGAGRMGTPMAERLIKAGYDVTVWNRTAPRPSRSPSSAARCRTTCPNSRTGRRAVLDRLDR